MPITPQDYNGDAILGEQLSKLMEKEIRDRLKGDVPETLAHALCVMAAEIDALKAAIAERNIGDRTADSVDAQELKVGGVNVLPSDGDSSDTTVAFSQASSRGTVAADFASGSKLSTLFGKIRKWFADLKTVAFTGSYNDLSGTPNLADYIQKSQTSGLVKNDGSIDTTEYAPANHASTATTYGQSTTINYGHAKLNNDTLNANSTGTAGVACSTGHKHSNLATSGAIGSGNQPVYFNADGYPTVIPVDPTYSDYLTLAVRTAKEAESANSAGSAAKLTNTSAIGSGNQPVYFNNQGVPIVIPFDSTYSDYLTLAVLTARAATVATSAGTATRLSNTGNIGSGNQPVYFSSQGLPTVVPFDATYPQYLTLAVLTARQAVTAGSADSASTATNATTASKLNASAGGPSCPVYFPDTGTNVGRPVPIPTSTDPEIAAVGDFLTMQVQGAFYAHNAGKAGSATYATKTGALDVPGAVGSALQPVYINANGVPTPIEALSPQVPGHNYMVMEVTSAQYAASAGQAGSAGTAGTADVATTLDMNTLPSSAGLYRVPVVNANKAAYWRGAPGSGDAGLTYNSGENLLEVNILGDATSVSGYKIVVGAYAGAAGTIYLC